MSKTTRTDGIPTLDECRVIVAPLIDDIKRRAHIKTLQEARERINATGGIGLAEMIHDFGGIEPEVAGRPKA